MRDRFSMSDEAHDIAGEPRHVMKLVQQEGSNGGPTL